MLMLRQRSSVAFAKAARSLRPTFKEKYVHLP